MPRDKVALLINSCAKKPKPRRVAAVAPSAPRPAQRSEHIDDALMATKRRRVAFGDVSIHVFPMAIADNPAVRSGVADADDDLARRVAQVELDAKAAEVAAPALATMDGSLHTLPSKPAAGLDDMDGSLYNLPAFG